MSKKKKAKPGDKIGLGWVLLVIFGILIALILIPKNQSEKIYFQDLHGLGFNTDGTKLVAAVHDGLKEYSEGGWTAPDIEKNDYMGFSPIKDGFYSSGHPGESSNLKNPLGIVKSTDNGKTIDIVDLHGEVDFHALTVGYETEEMYVFNPNANSKMKDSGFYYSADQAETWNQMKMGGVSGNPTTLIAHPTKKGVVALGTDKGLYLSNDYGETFKLILEGKQVSSAFFSSNNEIIVATNSNKKELLKIDFLNNKTTNYRLPSDLDGNITFISNNFKNKKELAIATDQLNIYISKDDGQNWEIVVNSGVGK